MSTCAHGKTQGPQGTVSSVVIEDEKRLLKSLREIKDLLDRFSPCLSARFNIKSILTLVAENTFSEMRTGASDMPLQLEFDYRFSRSIKERLKRQCLTPYSYFTSPSSYYPHTFVSANYSDLPKLRPPKRNNKLTVQQVHEMRHWRVILTSIIKMFWNLRTEEELILLQDEIQQTSDILTLTEATEISTDELGVSDVARHSSRRRKRRFAEDYLY